MNENKNNKGRGVFYGVIGVATLVVAIIGATFAYFTAQASAGDNVIGGNMANIGFNLQVQKVVDPGATKGGMIPMSNSMVQSAVSHQSATTQNTPEPCVDDALGGGNAVCQIYEITVTNTGSGTLAVDGFVALTGGSGVPTDTTVGTTNPTTMRWAQVFKTGDGASATYSTAGTQVLGADGSAGTIDMTAITPASGSAENAHNTTNIGTTSADVVGKTTFRQADDTDAITSNYIRISNHALTQDGLIDADGANNFTRDDDITSMLVMNQELSPNSPNNQKKFYIVVWLSENGLNQTANSGGTAVPTTVDNFFSGLVKFISAQSNEVTATFSGYYRVPSNTVSP